MQLFPGRVVIRVGLFAEVFVTSDEEQLCCLGWTRLLSCFISRHFEWQRRSWGSQPCWMQKIWLL